MWAVGEEVGDLVVVNGIVVGGAEGTGGRVLRRGGIVKIVLIIIDGLIGAPLDNEARRLEKGLLLMEGDGLDTRDSRVGDGEHGPGVT